MTPSGGTKAAVPGENLTLGCGVMILQRGYGNNNSLEASSQSVEHARVGFPQDQI
jgi:hypothetical protein